MYLKLPRSLIYCHRFAIVRNLYHVIVLSQRSGAKNSYTQRCAWAICSLKELPQSERYDWMVWSHFDHFNLMYCWQGFPTLLSSDWLFMQILIHVLNTYLILTRCSYNNIILLFYTPILYE